MMWEKELLGQLSAQGSGRNFAKYKKWDLHFFFEKNTVPVLVLTVKTEKISEFYPCSPKKYPEKEAFHTAPE